MVPLTERPRTHRERAVRLGFARAIFENPQLAAGQGAEEWHYYSRSSQARSRDGHFIVTESYLKIIRLIMILE